MRNTRFITTAAIAVFALFSLSGCISSKSGGGSVSREEALRITGSEFAPVTQAQKESFAQLDQSQSWSEERPSFICAGDSFWTKTMQKTDESIWKIFKSGWMITPIYNMERFPKGENREVFCREAKLFLPGFPLVPLVWTSWDATYLKSNGEQVSHNGYYGVGLACIIAGKWNKITPANLDLPEGKTPDKYDACNFWFFAAGLFGGGRMNHVYYGQFFWMAFPVGNAD